MSILKRLQISHLRNLEQVSLTLSPKINLFYGENGSGKTSLLEALSLLGLGRSFRSHKIRSLINHNQQQLTIFADIDIGDSNAAVGIQKGRNGSTLIRINGETVPSAVLLAQKLPLQIIDANSFQLIEGSPLQRRRFLDWMVFHVKPEFIEPWRRLQRVIKQRNSLLKRDKIARLDLEPWDKEFVELAILIHRFRKSVFEEFHSLFGSFRNSFSKAIADVAITYHPGWNEEHGFREVLEESFDRDKRDGYSHYGPQRAEIKFTVEGKPALDVLSRGQEKTLICGLHIAQAKLHQQKTDQKSVFLVDDLLAELDDQNAVRLINWLVELGGQVFVTGVSKDSLLKTWFQQQTSLDDDHLKVNLFHVEQGNIGTEDFSKSAY